MSSLSDFFTFFPVLLESVIVMASCWAFQNRLGRMSLAKQLADSKAEVKNLRRLKLVSSSIGPKPAMTAFDWGNIH
jgi:hypothetical protein